MSLQEPEYGLRSIEEAIELLMEQRGFSRPEATRRVLHGLDQLYLDAFYPYERTGPNRHQGDLCTCNRCCAEMLHRRKRVGTEALLLRRAGHTPPVVMDF